VFPLRKDVALPRQGTQGGPVQLFKQAGPASIRAFAEGRDGSIWIATDEGVFVQLAPQS